MLKKVLGLAAAISLTFLTGCGDVEIFVKPEPDYVVEVSDSELQLETYYVKNGTKFSKVYMPNGNVSNMSRTVNPKRVLYFNGDEKMIPVHYKGELVAYSSTSADLKEVCLERYKDMGFSLGIYGGKMEEDGYYHFSVKKNTTPGSNANELFQYAVSDEIRVISVGGAPVGDYVDEGSGIITGMEEGKSYTLEFYSGTYYFRQSFIADTHFLKSFEVYSFGKENISDTTHGYMCFNTPEDLKSGYYLCNGQGLFIYHDYVRGETVEFESLNENFYSSQEEMIATYSKQYQVSVPQATKDMKILVKYRTATNSEEDIMGCVAAPDGTIYDMTIDQENDILEMTISYAIAGDWIIYVTPKTLTIDEVKVTNDVMLEETVCEEAEFEVDEDTEYKMFYADISGEGDVYGSIIGPNGITYNFAIGEYRDEAKIKHKYMYYRLPYVTAGTYKVKIYHYISQTQIANIQMVSYDESENEIIVIE